MKRINDSDNSLKNIKSEALYNCRVVKRQDKDNSIVELKRIGGKKPKYVDWDSFNTFIAKVDSKFDKQSKLLKKIANKVGV